MNNSVTDKAASWTALAPPGLHTGQDDNEGCKEVGHAGQDDDGAKVFDCLGGLYLLDQLLLFHVHTKAEEMLQIDGKEIQPD